MLCPEYDAYRLCAHSVATSISLRKYSPRQACRQADKTDTGTEIRTECSEPKTGRLSQAELKTYRQARVRRRSVDRQTLTCSLNAILVDRYSVGCTYTKGHCLQNERQTKRARLRLRAIHRQRKK